MTDFEKFRQSLTENQRDTSNYRVRRLWELFGKPSNAQEAVNRGAYDIDPDGKLHAYSVSPIPNENGEYEFLKPKTHNTIGYEVTPYIIDPGHPYHNKEMILDWTKDVPVYRNRRIYEKSFPAGAYVGNIPNETLTAGWNYMLDLSNYFDYFK